MADPVAGPVMGRVLSLAQLNLAQLHPAQATALVPGVATTQPVRIAWRRALHPDKAGDLRPGRMPRTKPKERAPTRATYWLRVSCQNLRMTKLPREHTTVRGQLNPHREFFFLLNSPCMASRACWEICTHF